MIHQISIDTYPNTIPELALLYNASRKKSIKGTLFSEERNRLARAMGAGKIAELLRSGDPIRVRPKSKDTWEIIEEESRDHIDRALLAAMNDEMKLQGLSQSALAQKAGLPQQTVNKFFSEVSGIGWFTLKRLLRALDKSLTWLDKGMQEYKEKAK